MLYVPEVLRLWIILFQIRIHLGREEYIPTASTSHLLRAIYLHLPFLNSQTERSVPQRAAFMPVTLVSSISWGH